MKTLTQYVIIALFLTSLFALNVTAQSSDSTILTLNLLNQDPDPALAGAIVELRIGIGNQGSEAAKDLILRLIPEYPFTMVPGEDPVQNVGTIGAFEYDDDRKIVKYKIRVDYEATEGTYDLKVQYHLTNQPGIVIQKTLVIDVKSSDSAEIIYIDQVELLPGKITPLTFTINNVGSAPLRDVTFSWSNADGVILPVGSDDTKYINYLDVGESVDIIYDVVASANADPDLYKLALLLTYDDSVSGATKEITTNAGIYVGGGTDFDIAYSGISGGQTSFSIANIGAVQANSVTIHVPDQQGWLVSGIDSVIIGNLNKGDYTIASFNVQKMAAPSSEEKDSSRAGFRRGEQSDELSVEISYTDTRGQRLTVTKKVSIDSSASFGSSDGSQHQAFSGPGGRTPPGQSSSTSKYLWIGLVIIVAVGGYYWNKRRRPKKK